MQMHSGTEPGGNSLFLGRFELVDADKQRGWACYIGQQVQQSDHGWKSPRVKHVRHVDPVTGVQGTGPELCMIDPRVGLVNAMTATWQGRGSSVPN